MDSGAGTRFFQISFVEYVNKKEPAFSWFLFIFEVRILQPIAHSKIE